MQILYYFFGKLRNFVIVHFAQLPKLKLKYKIINLKLN